MFLSLLPQTILYESSTTPRKNPNWRVQCMWHYLMHDGLLSKIHHVSIHPACRHRDQYHSLIELWLKNLANSFCFPPIIMHARSSWLKWPKNTFHSRQGTDHSSHTKNPLKTINSQITLKALSFPTILCKNGLPSQSVQTGRHENILQFSN